jgi:hypothetical protein
MVNRDGMFGHKMQLQPSEQLQHFIRNKYVGHVVIIVSQEISVVTLSSVDIKVIEP